MTRPGSQPAQTAPVSAQKWDVWCPQEGFAIIEEFQHKRDADEAAKEHNAQFSPPHKAHARVHHHDHDDPPDHT
jgi:hypothetical protein